MVMSSLSKGGPVKLFSKSGTWCTGGLVENNPHGIVLYTFNVVGDRLGTCMPDGRAVVHIWEDKGAVEHLPGVEWQMMTDSTYTGYGSKGFLADVGSV